MTTTDERRRSFDQIAELYARARPAAPPELFDALAAYVPAPADALEIGCGPGNASLPLLERGFRIHAVEIGENLAAFARQRCAAFPFTVEIAKFEDAALTPASVDLVVCSAAFHWLDRARALAQVVKVLKPGGSFALIWGSARRTTLDDRVDAALQPAYRAHAPEISRETMERVRGTADDIGRAVSETPELRDYEERVFPQTHVFDRAGYVETLSTFSDHATLPPDRRARLFEAVGEIIDRDFGGRVERHSMARLQLAKRA
ncbi:MAG TPA: class I SAM-dependent methyltransferase [Polyangiaceae bacterium]|nr:class I SAM-dependent methyltransferase [Polyangiaceae bacterium]